MSALDDAVANGLRVQADVLDIAREHISDPNLITDPVSYLQQFAESLRRAADTYSPRQEG